MAFFIRTAMRLCHTIRLNKKMSGDHTQRGLSRFHRTHRSTGLNKKISENYTPKHFSLFHRNHSDKEALKNQTPLTVRNITNPQNDSYNTLLQPESSTHILPALGSPYPQLNHLIYSDAPELENYHGISSAEQVKKYRLEQVSTDAQYTQELQMEDTIQSEASAPPQEILYVYNLQLAEQDILEQISTDAQYAQKLQMEETIQPEPIASPQEVLELQNLQLAEQYRLDQISTDVQYAQELHQYPIHFQNDFTGMFETPLKGDTQFFSSNNALVRSTYTPSFPSPAPTFEENTPRQSNGYTVYDHIKGFDFTKKRGEKSKYTKFNTKSITKDGTKYTWDKGGQVHTSIPAFTSVPFQNTDNETSSILSSTSIFEDDTDNQYNSNKNSWFVYSHTKTSKRHLDMNKKKGKEYTGTKTSKGFLSLNGKKHTWDRTKQC